MLILSRRPGESVTIGDDIVVTVLETTGSQIRLGISAPRAVRVLREEIYRAMQEEIRAAATAHNSGRKLEDALKQLGNQTGRKSDE